MINEGFDPSSRRFGKTIFAGDNSAIVPTNTPGIKLAIQLSDNPSEDDFTLVKQLDVKNICIWTVRVEKATYENYFRLRKLLVFLL